MDRPGADRRGRACRHAVPRGGDIALAAHCVMRVLHVVAGAATGGAETFSLDAITALAERGIEQKVLCRPHRQTLVRLGEAAVPYETLAFRPAARLVGGPAAIRHAAMAWGADLVHAWMSRAASFVPARMPCPVIGWMGGYYNLQYFTTAGYLIGVTPRIRDYIVERGVAPQRAFVCHTFGTMPHAPPVSRASLGVPQGALLLLTLSRLHPKKGIDTAIRALARLANAHLCVAGDGPEQGKYETLARELGLAERVHFLGWRSDRKAMLVACGSGLLPSPREPFGALRAWWLASGRPL